MHARTRTEKALRVLLSMREHQMLQDCDYKMSSNNDTLQSQACYYDAIFHFAFIVNGKWILNRQATIYVFALCIDLVLNANKMV